MKSVFPFVLFFLFYLMQIFNLSFSKNYLINTDWFKNFNDENLMNCIFLALENNKDIIIAKNNILKSRLDKNLSISEEFPEINLGADYLLLKIPKSTIPDNDIQTNSFALPLSTIWEIDYLGKKYNKIQIKKLDIKNSYQNLRSSNILVATDVACVYFNISNLNKLIELQNKRKEILEILNKRKAFMYEKGIINSLELNESFQFIENEKNEIENLKKLRTEFITKLCYLTGLTPYEADKITVSSFDKIEYKKPYPNILKGDIICSRPDIIKLENEIKKKKFDILIAKKEFLPKIQIEGNLIFSTIINNFGWEGALAALVAGAVQNIFDGGKRIFTLKKRKIEYEIAMNEFLKADLNALKELNDTLYNLKKDIEIYKNNEKNLYYENSNLIKTKNAYISGVKSYIDYLEKDSERIDKIKTLYNSKNQKFIDLISLYKAAGGAL